MEDMNSELGYDGDGDGATYSQLLFDGATLSDDYSSSPNMLCFGKLDHPAHVGLISETPVPKSGILITSGETTSSSASSNNLSNKRASEMGICGAGAGERQRSVKKKSTPVPENSSSSTGRERVRREKLGERIAVLQQLVSPYGKTDTASVLHEAMGYIRFLHEQVQVLCSPYLQTLLPSPSTIQNWRSGNGEEEEKQGKGQLRSKGLCLIPVDCTLPLANENGADLWTPAMVGSNNNNNNDGVLLFNH